MATRNYLSVVSKNHHIRRDAEMSPGEQRSPMPPKWVLDAIADEKRDQGWKGRQLTRKNQCMTCFELKSANGSCGCE